MTVITIKGPFDSMNGPGRAGANLAAPRTGRAPVDGRLVGFPSKGSLEPPAGLRPLPSISTAFGGLRTDGLTWPLQGRNRRVIVVADLVQSVRLMELSEDSVIDRWRWLVQQLRTNVLPLHDGKLVKSLGDGVLLQCERAPQAVALAFDMHRLVSSMNEGIDPRQRFQLRVGIHVGHVVEDELDIYGTTVNLASRIAALARPGGVAASVDVVREAGWQAPMCIEDLGYRALRHVGRAVHIFYLQPAMRAALLGSRKSARAAVAVAP